MVFLKQNRKEQKFQFSVVSKKMFQALRKFSLINFFSKKWGKSSNEIPYVKKHLFEESSSEKAERRALE